MWQLVGSCGIAMGRKKASTSHHCDVSCCKSNTISIAGMLIACKVSFSFYSEHDGLNSDECSD